LKDKISTHSDFVVMDTEPRWRRFEKLVAQVQQELAPNAVVTHDDKIRGHNSGQLRQVDITVKQRVGQYDILIAIDCKDYKRAVNLNEVEKFIGLITDIKANKGVMVAANGFSNTAKSVGEKAGLDLYRLIDTDTHDWQTYASIPVLCDFRGIEKHQFIFHTSTANVKINPREAIEIILYDVNCQPLGKVVNLLKARWNANELPSEPGEHRDIILTKAPTMILYDDKFFEVRVTANIIVKRRLFFGQLSLTQLKGFRDEKTGYTITRGFTTEGINFDEVERSWRRLRNEEEIAIEPLIKFQALDYYTISEE